MVFTVASSFPLLFLFFVVVTCAQEDFQTIQFDTPAIGTCSSSTTINTYVLNVTGWPIWSSPAEHFVINLHIPPEQQATYDDLGMYISRNKQVSSLNYEWTARTATGSVFAEAWMNRLNDSTIVYIAVECKKASFSYTILPSIPQGVFEFVDVGVYYSEIETNGWFAISQTNLKMIKVESCAAFDESYNVYAKIVFPPPAPHREQYTFITTPQMVSIDGATNTAVAQQGFATLNFQWDEIVASDAPVYVYVGMNDEKGNIVPMDGMIYSLVDFASDKFFQTAKEPTSAIQIGDDLFITSPILETLVDVNVSTISLYYISSNPEYNLTNGLIDSMCFLARNGSQFLYNGLIQQANASLVPNGKVVWQVPDFFKNVDPTDLQSYVLSDNDDWLILPHSSSYVTFTPPAPPTHHNMFFETTIVLGVVCGVMLIAVILMAFKVRSVRRECPYTRV